MTPVISPSIHSPSAPIQNHYEKMLPAEIDLVLTTVAGVATIATLAA